MAQRKCGFLGIMCLQTYSHPTPNESAEFAGTARGEDAFFRRLFIWLLHNNVD